MTSQAPKLVEFSESLLIALMVCEMEQPSEVDTESNVAI